MYGPPGIAYVYLVYGMHECLNVVTEPDGHPMAVLIRAVEPVTGVAAMRAARLTHAQRFARTDAARERTRIRIESLAAQDLAAGPGLVSAAFDIHRGDTGTDLLDPGSGLRIEQGPSTPTIVQTARVGIDYAPEPWRSMPWRFLAASEASPRTKPPRARS
jgi:DNA-3-methyladenine glycosylase